MAKSRVTAGLQTIPRLSGVMSRKGQHAQTLCHQLGILATLGHTKRVPLLLRHSVDQELGDLALQEAIGLPDNLIMEPLVAMVVVRHMALVDHTFLNSLRDSFHLLSDLQVHLQVDPQVDLWLEYYLQYPLVDLQDMGPALGYPLGQVVAPKDLGHRCRMEALNCQAKMEALDHQGIMEALDHLDKMKALDHLAKLEALDHQGIMEPLDHQGIMEALDHPDKTEALDYLGKMGDLVHLSNIVVLDHLGIMEDQVVALDLVKVTMGQDSVDPDPIRIADLTIREGFKEEILEMEDLGHLEDQANMAPKEEVATKVGKGMVDISMGWSSLDRDAPSLHSVIYEFCIN